jgi:hypothetical protein
MAPSLVTAASSSTRFRPGPVRPTFQRVALSAPIRGAMPLSILLRSGSRHRWCCRRLWTKRQHRREWPQRRQRRSVPAHQDPPGHPKRLERRGPAASGKRSGCDVQVREDRGLRNGVGFSVNNADWSINGSVHVGNSVDAAITLPASTGKTAYFGKRTLTQFKTREVQVQHVHRAAVVAGQGPEVALRFEVGREHEFV